MTLNTLTAIIQGGLSAVNDDGHIYVPHGVDNEVKMFYFTVTVYMLGCVHLIISLLQYFTRSNTLAVI